MADFVRRAGVRLRPHAKTHKSPDHRRRGRSRSAPSACAARRCRRPRRWSPAASATCSSPTRWRARAKLDRLAALARRARIGVCVDDPDSVAEIEAAAAQGGRALDVLVEIDVGGRRCGVAPGEPAARHRPARSPARRICASPACRPTTARPSTCARPAERKAHDRARGGAREGDAAGAGGRRALRPPTSSAAPAPAPTRTRRRAASTPSCRPAPTSSWTPTMPATSAATAAPFDTFEHALFVYATVMSAPAPERRVVDAGHKALAVDSGMPTPWQLAGAIYHRPSDEHGILDVAGLQPTARRAATRCCWCPATAIRPSTCTTGTSACAGWATRRGACRMPVAGGGARRAVLISFASALRKYHCKAIVKPSSPPDMLAIMLRGRMPMTPEERQLIAGLFDRMRSYGRPRRTGRPRR